MASNDHGPPIGLYEPVAPPRYPISSSNQGGYAFVASLLVVLIAGLAVLVKLHMTTTTFRKLRRDDIALTGALVRRSVAFCASAYRSCGTGSGLTCIDLRRRLYHFDLQEREPRPWEGG